VLAETARLVGPDQGNVPVETSETASVLRSSLDCLWVFSVPVRISHWRKPKSYRHLPKPWFTGAILLAILPLLLNGLLWLIHGGWALHSAKAWLWLSIFAGAQASILLAARMMWGRVVRDIPLIVRMLPDDPADSNIAAWIRKWYSIPWQAMLAAVLAGLGVSVLRLAEPDVRPHLELGPVSYIAVAWTSITGALVFYVFLMATLLAVKIGACGPLDLDPWDPATTPGLRTLSRGYIYCLVLMIVLAGGLETAAIVVPGYRESMALRGFVVGFAAFTVLCGLFVTLVPHSVIAHLTWVRKMETLILIDGEIGDIQSTMKSDHGRLAVLVWLRSQVLGGRVLPIRVPWLVPMLAALVGPLLAFVLALKHL
jgi:hypothetical protein